MLHLLLEGKTLKGRNRVSELGGEWMVLLTRPTVSFSDAKGWMLIAPLKNSEKIRWIRMEDDPDFKVLHAAEVG